MDFLLNNMREADMFSTPISLNMKRGRGKKKAYHNSYSSNLGIFTTFLCQTLCLSYLIYMILRMYSLEDDQYGASTMVNHMKD